MTRTRSRISAGRAGVSHLGFAAAAIAASLVVAPPAAALRPEPPAILLPAGDLTGSRRQRKRAAARAARRRAHMSRYRQNRIKAAKRRAALTYDDARAALLVERLTNWQRSQWARAGYPRKNSQEIEPFARMIRPAAHARLARVLVAVMATEGGRAEE